jgi:hypothetical protein
MKKMAFALQVFTLMMILPLYVVIEMNHSTVTPPENNTVTKLTRKEKSVPVVFNQTQAQIIKT